MSLVCVGINHQLAPVDLRERFAVPEHSVADVLERIRESSQLEECVVVSTCNRVEFYASADTTPTVGNCTEKIAGFVRENVSAQGSTHTEIPLYTHEGINAARHLFRVASGLDSMVLGETEIFGQLKRAYHLAQRQGATRGALNRLFQSAFRVGKRVRSETDIQRGATSVGSVAVDLAEKIFGNLDACRVLILGAGEISRTTTKSLASRGVQDITVANRSIEKALELASAMGGRALAFNDWSNCLNSIDIVLSSTSAAQYVVTPEAIRAAMARRKGNPLFLIDLAVPRDIDPAIETLDNVYLYDIDALQSTASRARKLRERQIAICEQVIEEEARDFFRRLS
jgi:glutamyl-tRNA reductase